MPPTPNPHTPHAGMVTAPLELMKLLSDPSARPAAAATTTSSRSSTASATAAASFGASPASIHSVGPTLSSVFYTPPPAAAPVETVPAGLAAAGSSGGASTSAAVPLAANAPTKSSGVLVQAAGQLRQHLRNHVPSLRTRLYWCMFEGAVFFPSLEGSIAAYDWLFHS